MCCLTVNNMFSYKIEEHRLSRWIYIQVCIRRLWASTEPHISGNLSKTTRQMRRSDSELRVCVCVLAFYVVKFCFEKTASVLSVIRLHTQTSSHPALEENPANRTHEVTQPHICFQSEEVRSDPPDCFYGGGFNLLQIAPPALPAHPHKRKQTTLQQRGHIRMDYEAEMSQIWRGVLVWIYRYTT